MFSPYLIDPADKIVRIFIRLSSQGTKVIQYHTLHLYYTFDRRQLYFCRLPNTRLSRSIRCFVPRTRALPIIFAYNSFRNMASTAPPVVASHPLVNPQYDLKELPTVPGARPDRVVLDAFKLGAAKLVAEAWDIDVAKVFASVDISKSSRVMVGCMLMIRQERSRPFSRHSQVLQEGPGRLGKEGC
jgi:hypothetical protein